MNDQKPNLFNKNIISLILLVLTIGMTSVYVISAYSKATWQKTTSSKKSSRQKTSTSSAASDSPASSSETLDSSQTPELTYLTIGEAYSPMTEGAIGLTVSVLAITPTEYALENGGVQPAIQLDMSFNNWATVPIGIEAITVSDATGYTTITSTPIENVTTQTLTDIAAGTTQNVTYVFPVTDPTTTEIQYNQAKWRYGV